MKNIYVFAAVVMLSAVCGVPVHAAKAPPAGVGGMPYEAPLQPLPQGVGANISNNIQQEENAGPPDSARTVTPVAGGEGAEVPLVTENKNLTPEPANPPSKTKTLFMWLGLLLGLGGGVGGIWFIANRYASK